MASSKAPAVATRQAPLQPEAEAVQWLHYDLFIPATPAPAQWSQRPGPSGQDPSARQATVPWGGNPQPVPEWCLADLPSRPPAGVNLACAPPSCTRHVAPAAKIPQSTSPLTRLPAAVLGIRRPSRRAIIAQGGGDRRPCPSLPSPLAISHATRRCDGGPAAFSQASIWQWT